MLTECQIYARRKATPLAFYLLTIAAAVLLTTTLARAQSYCDVDPTQCGPANQCAFLPPQWCACENDPASCLSGGAGVSRGGVYGSSGGLSPPYTPSAPKTPQGPDKSIVQQKCPSGANDTMVAHFVALGTKGNFIAERQTDVFGQRIKFIAGSGLPAGRGLERTRTAATVKDTDPVAPNGEFVIDTTDVTLPGYGLPFTFTRHYRSGVIYSTSLGYGWNHEYARRIVSLRTTPTAATPSRCLNKPREVAYVDARMNRVHFVFATSNGAVDTYQPTAGEDLRLTFEHHNNQWVLVGDGDTVARFDGSLGTLSSVSDYAGHTLTVTWDHASHPEWSEIGGVVTSVTDTTGRVIHFNYLTETATYTSTVTGLDETQKASGALLQCLSTASDCTSTAPLVSFDHTTVLVGTHYPDGNGSLGSSDVYFLEANLVAVHAADGSSISYTYDDRGNFAGKAPGEHYHPIHAPVVQSDDADLLCHMVCDADNATCSTVDSCQRAIDEMQTYMCDPISRGPTGFTVNRDARGALVSVTGPNADQPNPGTACYEFCMSEYYKGGTAAVYQNTQAWCVAYAENITIASDGHGYDACATQFQPDCRSQLDALQANIATCRSSCLNSCKTAFPPNSAMTYFDGLSNQHRILRVTDGEGRIVVDNEYFDEASMFDYGRVRYHAQGAALPGTAATTMSFATLDYASPVARAPMFCGPADSSLVAHTEVVTDTGGVTHTRDYDASWRLLQDVNNNANTTTTYVYAGDHLRGVREPSGAITCIDVDAMGKPTRITRTAAPGYHAKPSPVVTTLSWDTAEMLTEVVEDATGAAARGVHYIRDAAERVIAEAHQVSIQAADWTCYTFSDTPLGAGMDSRNPGQTQIHPSGSAATVPRAYSSIGAVASGMAAALTPNRLPPGPICPAWGCHAFPMFKPSGCAMSIVSSPHATDASYLRAVTPSTVTRTDGSAVLANNITVGGPKDVVVTDNDGVTPIMERYIDYDPYGRPSASGRVVASARVAGSGAATTYDTTSGHLLKVVREPANGGAPATTIYQYDKAGQLHQIQTPTFTRTFDVDALGHVFGVSDTPAAGDPTDPRRACMNIDVQGRLHDVINPEGDAAHYEYDAGGEHVVAVSRGALGSYGAWAKGCVQLSPKAMETFATYDFDGKSGFPKSRVVDQREIDYVVDGFGRIVDEVQFGHGVRVIVPNGPGGITTTTIPVNLHHWRNYNAFGEVTLETSYDVAVDKKFPPADFVKPSAPTPGMHFLVEHTYDRLGRRSGTTAWRFTEQPDDGLTQQTPVPDPSGDAYTTTLFDDVGDTITTSDQDGHVVVASVDPLGRPRHRTTAAGDATAIDDSYIWSSANNPAALDVVAQTHSPAPTSTGAFVRTVSLDAHGLVRSVVEADRAVAKVDFDDFDRLLHRTTPSGGAETFDVDAYGRLITTHRAAGADDVTSTRRWDRDDRVGAVIDGAQHATTYGFDPQGRLTSETTPLGTTQRTYVPGRMALQTVTPPGGAVSILYSYGPSNLVAPPGDGRLYARATLRGTATEREELYSYSDVGLLAGVQLGAGGSSWTRTYDSVGRVVTDTQPGGGITLRHSYTRNAEQVVLDGRALSATITRSFDAQHRIGAVAFDGGTVASFDYGTGALDAIHYANGITQSYTFDDRLRPLSATVAKAAPVASIVTTYGADDVPRARTRTLGAFTATDLFQADPIARVTAENLALPGVPSLGGTSAGNTHDLTNEDVQAAWSASAPNSGFVLDGASNWKARSGTVAFTPAIDSMNRYTAIDADIVGYDPLGNVSSYRDESYSFNGDGMLTSATKAGATTYYGYDGFGRRWYQLSGGHYTYYVWDGDAIVAIVPDGDPTRGQVRIGAGSDDTLALADAFGASPLHYVHAGSDGSALAATDASGVLVEGYAYSAYGDTTVLDTSGKAIDGSRINNRFLFQGQLFDSQLGEYSMRAREYRPGWGRFLSADPAGLAFGDNRYAFVDGRPLTMADPSGFCGQKLNDEAWAAGFDWSSTAALDDYYRGKHGLTAQYALEMAGVRSTASSVNLYKGNYFSAAANGFLGLSDTVGSTILGENARETVRNVEAGILIGGAVGTFFKWAASTSPIWRPLTSGATTMATRAVGGAAGVVVADEWATTSTEAEAAAATAAGGKNIALGIGEHLEQFAAQTGGSTWKEWAAQNPLNWKSSFADVVSNPANSVMFNLTGVDNAWTAVARAARGAGGATDWELLQIQQNPGWWSRIRFFTNGQAIPNPFQ